jgi:hypothetical protein
MRAFFLGHRGRRAKKKTTRYERRAGLVLVRNTFPR